MKRVGQEKPTWSTNRNVEQRAGNRAEEVGNMNRGQGTINKKKEQLNIR